MLPRVLLAILVLIPLPSLAIDTDKKLHFGVSTAVGAASQVFVGDWRASMSICMGVGLAKELYDEYSYNGFDTEDLLWDAAGCAAGVIVGDTALTIYQSNDAIGLYYSFDF